jgi:rhodanese-related sulfurtransferase
MPGVINKARDVFEREIKATNSLSLSLTSFFSSCAILSLQIKEKNMAHAPKFLSIVDDAKKRVKETNVADVKRRIDAGEKLVLVDVREESEWANGHLPGAIYLGKGVIERDIEARVPATDTKLILYCGGGFRSALAADNLQKMGYTNVESMDGGWKGWLAAGLPTQKG